MKFVSKYPELRLVMKPTFRQIVGFTSQLVTGKAIEFKDGEYRTEDKEEIDFIKGSDSFRRKIIFEVEEVDQEAAILKMAEEIKAKKEKEASVVVPTADELSCKECGFKSESKVGISAHKRSHK